MREKLKKSISFFLCDSKIISEKPTTSKGLPDRQVLVLKVYLLKIFSKEVSKKSYSIDFNNTPVYIFLPFEKTHMGKSLSNEEIEKSWGKKFTVIHDDIKQENLSFYENGENIKSFCTPLAEEWKNFFLFCSLGSDYFLGCDGWEHWISQEENDQLEAAKEKADELIRKTKEELWSPQTPWWESSEKKEERFLEKVKEILDQLNQEPENATKIEKIVWEKHEEFN